MSDKSEHKSYSVNIGGGLGGILAAAMSYYINGSIGWAILHFFCTWIYVVYALFKYADLGTKLFGGH